MLEFVILNSGIDLTLNSTQHHDLWVAVIGVRGGSLLVPNVMNNVVQHLKLIWELLHAGCLERFSV